MSAPTNPSFDLAHLGHVEMLTDKYDESLDFFTRVYGLKLSGEDETSAYLRAWDDYEYHSLKLTRAETTGVGHIGYRAASPEALERRDERRLVVGADDRGERRPLVGGANLRDGHPRVREIELEGRPGILALERGAMIAADDDLRAEPIRGIHEIRGLVAVRRNQQQHPRAHRAAIVGSGLQLIQ